MVWSGEGQSWCRRQPFGRLTDQTDADTRIRRERVRTNLIRRLGEGVARRPCPPGSCWGQGTPAFGPAWILSTNSLNEGTAPVPQLSPPGGVAGA